MMVTRATKPFDQNASLSEIEALLHTPAYAKWVDNMFVDPGVISIMKMIADAEDYEDVDNVLLCLYIAEDAGKVDAQIQLQTWSDGDDMELKETRLFGLGSGSDKAFTLVAQLCQPYLSGFPGIIDEANAQLRQLIDLASELAPPTIEHRQDFV